MKHEDLVYLVNSMIRKDADNLRMMQEMDNMWHGNWSLPEALSGLRWIRKTVSSDPHDAVRAGTRVLSSVSPRLKMTPLAPNDEDREKTGRIERALSWHLDNAFRRRGRPLHDIVRHAILYDKCAVQVVHLDTQIKATEAFKGNTRRLEYARRHGPFTINVRNPKDVHAEWSDWMPERVVYRSIRPVNEVVDFWGTNSKELKKAASRKKGEGMEYVTIYDYTDMNMRKVWAILQNHNTGYVEPDQDGVVLLEEKNELDFLPWVIKDGGEQLIPLLYSVYKTGQWETQNVVETLMTSEVIAYASAPRLKIEGPTDNVDIDYGEPGRIAHVPPAHELTEMLPPQFDQSLQAISEIIQTRISKSTVPNVIQTGDFPSGTAYATLNLATQSGVKALNPYKELAQETIAEVARHMLYWINEAGEEVVSFVQPDERQNSEQAYINPNEYDVNNLYIEVELTADVPTDRMARINAAVTAKDKLKYSNYRSLEDINVPDPLLEMKNWEDEMRRENEFQMELLRERATVEREEQLKTMQAQMELQLQQQQQMMQMQQQQAQQAQQQGGGQGGGELREQLRNMETQHRFARNRGQRSAIEENPALGGAPPAMGNPGATREAAQSANGTQTSISEGA